ncbi:RagB/SusD family nutrient uptake outer membrane protein [Pedobacter deserti]|uniref:RagB/SusD family nutrient uptake outer membrane protein n=1 Tax=Pedobacter deserti TaxID=2817382 RepID=UPI00210B3DC3|nr:RagB/SusD family nutrient uptake outer membrane protein [Pedobacter sp. SYSU D00382]
MKTIFYHTKARTVFSLILTLLYVLIIPGCKKFVEVSAPTTSNNGENVFLEDASAIGVLTGIYANMSNSNVNVTNGYLTNVFFTTGLAGDELDLFDPVNPAYSPYLNNSIRSSEASSWANIYKMIFVTNSALEGISQSESLNPLVKKQLLGEALFIRSLCYFYLVNIYGDVPLVLTTDYNISRFLGRAEIAKVYTQIIDDLIDAKSLLSPAYLENDLQTTTSQSQRIRPTKYAAIALLARIYLYTKNYSAAEESATELIEQSDIFSLSDLNDVFHMNNQEAIWQLQPVGSSSSNTANTKEGILLKLPEIAINSLYPVFLREALVEGFDDRDQRKSNWIGKVTYDGKTFYYPAKYKIGRENSPAAEYSTVLRLAEQYIIRAESRIQLGKINDGISDLNIIRERASDNSLSLSSKLPRLPNDLDKEEALIAVELERRHELFTEWGHRWFDLKRTGRADVVLKALKGSNWQVTDQLFPIPQSDIEKNQSLVGHQNPGYN